MAIGNFDGASDTAVFMRGNLHAVLSERMQGCIQFLHGECLDQGGCNLDQRRGLHTHGDGFARRKGS